MVFWVLLLLITVPMILYAITYICENIEYRKSIYYRETRLSYGAVKGDAGKYGEYLIYNDLRSFEEKGAKFLFNVYIPKASGDTTEIDVLMISSKGLFVFESKNYSGWIFGSENQKNWYQTLPAGRGRSHKENFYNPVMQNRSHIKHLRTFLDQSLPIKSIIVFSNRCELKNIEISTKDVCVINRNQALSLVSKIYEQSVDVLSQSDIEGIYSLLYPFTQVDNAVKQKHIENIHSRFSSDTAVKTTPVDSVTDDKTVKSEGELSECESNAAADAEISCAMSEKEAIPQQDETNAESFDEVVRVEQGTEDANQLKCPKCGGVLILRTAVRGDNAGNRFFGCSNYPKCRYIRNLTEK